MGKLGKVILVTLTVGLICAVGFYCVEDLTVKFTIALAYGMFLFIYGMIVANPFKPSPNIHEFEYEVEEETKINNE